MSDISILAEPLLVGSVTLRNRVFLAPMSGVTDLPFRRRAHGHGAGLVVSEMVASGELAKGRDESARRINRPDIDVHMVQLAGREAYWMAEAARIAEAGGADIIDINMGCPAKKVTGGYSGSALMREPEHALTLIEAVVKAVTVPVTLKMRLGWDENSHNAPDIAAQAEAAGVQMITIHGRTRCQFYKGEADWDAIRAVSQAVRVPVVANGDVKDVRDLPSILQKSGADAVMVGRAHYGAPWTAGMLANAARGVAQAGAALPDNPAEYVAAHYEDMLSLYGIRRGVQHSRKHLGWYAERFAPDLSLEKRKMLMTQTDPAVALTAIRQLFPTNSENQRRLVA
ncbi:tRNA dihydrouridine synthase DusB [Nitratireductor basaltis]|uniref:tRNA-dihydrouridine synthase n=1 Tax=Nitratireductor basaltis TaxID=472175 RepID=A0A084UAK2_9HYPH|nr:tRNA dihydrouridine synthase DusB [Nitratireductor basaltis]KFB09988.1 tRNA-dihydrouridine synthase [Nitratireductor basaltis]